MLAITFNKPRVGDTIVTDALDLSPRASGQPEQLRQPLPRNSAYPFPWPTPRQSDIPVAIPDGEQGGSLWRGLAWASALGAVFWLLVGLLAYQML